VTVMFREKASALRAFSALVCWMVFVTPATHSAALPGAGRIVTYAVVDQDLDEVLRGICNEAGVRASVSPDVKGRVHGRLAPAPADALLSDLGRLFGFDWYFDGATVAVTPSKDTVTKLVALGPLDPAVLLQTLDATGIADPRWPIRVVQPAAAESGRSSLIVVSGPPRYLTLVDQATAALSGRTAGRSEPRVFRGSVAAR
jgi:type III secretion protein C